MKRVLVTAIVGGVALVAGSATWADEGGIPAQPVRAKSVGKGLKLWVFVYYGKGDKGGGNGGGKPGGRTVDCTDVDTQTGSAAPFAYAEPLDFDVLEASAPSEVGQVTGLLGDAAGASWNAEGASLSFQAGDGTTPTRPAQDGTNVVGWAKLVPKRVLAATWVWTDQSNHIVEADLFYNTSQPWAVLGSCPTSPTGRFDVADIGVHELGHALGLDHFQDAGRQATMYPSAPPDEVRKTTLTAGDVAALATSLNG